jgi:microcystin-dependent protein
MSLNATNLFIQASPIPATFKGAPNDLFTEMIKRMRILSPSGTNFIYVGDTAPSSNVGPWLKGGTQWYVWDPATKTYVPQDISASFTSAFHIGNSLPPSTNPTVWLKTTKDATTSSPLDFGNLVRWFGWNGALWVAPHNQPPSGNDRHLWVGSETELWGYDGGDGNNPLAIAPTDTTGAMWQTDTNFSFRFPLGVGTNPTAYDGNPANAVAVGGTGGEERHVLTAAELKKHTHFLANSQAADVTGVWPTAAQNIAVEGGGAGTADFAYAFSPSKSAAAPDVGLSGETGGDQSHQNMPPFIGVYFIKRTARKFYTP